MDKSGIKEFFHLPVYGLEQKDKQLLINDSLNELNQHHYNNCQMYSNLIDSMHYSKTTKLYSEQPYVMSRLFKMLELKSIGSDRVFKQLNSSGTISQQVSKIYLDADSAKLQSKVLAKILLDLFERKQLGKKRLPMLLIESPDVIKNKQSFSARGAGIQGISFLGREHTYALNPDMSINYKVISEFFEQFKTESILIFGFTYMIWKYFIQELKESNTGFYFNKALLLHSGGWKKLQSMAVSNNAFQDGIRDVLGNVFVHNFYGMVEQTGTIHIECEQGYLHTPVYADIIIRETKTFKELKFGQKGLIQLFSVLPHSYPGQSLLTEDIGEIIGQDDCACGRKGRYFKVYGRLAQSEVRGCSDTYQ